jgi:hypothetical protein
MSLVDILQTLRVKHIQLLSESLEMLAQLLVTQTLKQIIVELCRRRSENGVGSR